MYPGFLTVFHIYAERVTMFDRIQYQMEHLYVGFIFIRISIRVLVKDIHIVRLEQRRHVFKTGIIKIKQANTRIKGNGFQPAFLQHGKRHGWRVPDGRCTVR